VHIDGSFTFSSQCSEASRLATDAQSYKNNHHGARHQGFACIAAQSMSPRCAYIGYGSGCTELWANELFRRSSGYFLDMPCCSFSDLFCKKATKGIL